MQEGSLGSGPKTKIASNQKNVLFDQGREAPHFLIGLSSVFEKKVGDF